MKLLIIEVVSSNYENLVENIIDLFFMKQICSEFMFLVTLEI